MIAQRNALLAWTGHSLSIKPQINTSMSLAHWGCSRVTGRGLLCLSGKGQIYQLALKSGEEYIVHPSNVIAYSIMQHAPQAYRFKSSNLRLQIPNAFSYLPDTRFFKVVRQSTVWRAVANTLFTIRTWARRSIWGDRVSFAAYSQLHLSDSTSTDVPSFPRTRQHSRTIQRRKVDRCIYCS